MVQEVIPTESDEQIAFVQWLNAKNIPHWRTPNETYTKSWKQKAMNKALGVQSGIPDLFVVVAGRVIGIEMKRIKGGVISDTQKYWIALLNKSGIETKVCKGAGEAIEYVEGFL